MSATPDQLDKILERIESGESQAEIAASLGIGTATLSRWLNANPEIAERSARARELSAEAWLDRGLEALRDAPPDQAEIARARALEQHFARRAAIRNPRYRDKQDHTLSAPDGGPVQTSLTVTFASPMTVFKPATNGNSDER